MENFNYESRKKLLNDYHEKFNKKNRLQLFLLDRVSKEILSQLKKYFSYEGRSLGVIMDAIDQYDQCNEKSPSDFMKKRYRKLVELCVPKADRDAYYAIIDKYNQFQYTMDMERRSVRSHRYGPHMEKVFFLLYDYYLFGLYECSISEYLINDMAEDKLDYKLKQSFTDNMSQLDDMIAAGIDSGDQSLIQAIEDIILNENNTTVVTTDIIRGIIKCSNDNLHKLLGDFLLAARLQEGVRQAVCENADCGTVEAFIYIFNVIYDNNLIRFSSVKRAVATWIGICDENNLDRITGKILLFMKNVIEDKSKTTELLQGNDSIEIMVALWGLGLYEVDDAIQAMDHYAKSGSRNQRLTMSYYNRSLSHGDFKEITARKMIEAYSDDYEMLAAFMPSYLSECDFYVNQVINRANSSIYRSIPVTHLFANEKEAYTHYEILKNVLENMPKKKIEYNPSIFPWYGVSLSKTQLVKRMCVIAYALGDISMMDYVASILSYIDASDGYSSRNYYIELLLHDPRTEIQKELLVGYMADRERESSEKAYELLKGMRLEAGHYLKLEALLRYKSNDVRANVIDLLLNQNGKDITASVSRIISDKREEVRTAGLDLVMQMGRLPEKADYYKECIKLVQNIENPTSKEKILMDEICGATNGSKVLTEEGYGLYQLKEQTVMPHVNYDKGILKEYFSVSESSLSILFERLENFIEAHENMEYTDHHGEVRLLANGIITPYRRYDKIDIDQMPLKELWFEFYDQEIKDYKTLLNLYMALHKGHSYIKRDEYFKKNEGLIIGKSLANFTMTDSKYCKFDDYFYVSIYHNILDFLMVCYKDKAINRLLAKAAFMIIVDEFPQGALFYETTSNYSNDPILITETGEMIFFRDCLASWDTEKEFVDRFQLFYLVDKIMQPYRWKDNKNKDYMGYRTTGYLNTLDYIKAHELALISANEVYKRIFEYFGLRTSLDELSFLNKTKFSFYDQALLAAFDINDEIDWKAHPFYHSCFAIYQTVVDKILEVELKRGDTATLFSPIIHSISAVYGIETLSQILTALGKDTLDRSNYTWSDDTSKKSCLSHLLRVCYPKKEDTLELLSKHLKDAGISQRRLIETSLFAPQWMDLIGEYLDIAGFKSGCYYFMAHMNEKFDDKKKAMIAVYTPIDPEKLYQGAFDLHWFKEAFDLLGEDNFNILYDSAKYISDGSKHARARKYADAALGRVTRAELEKTINEKRNKDLLMSYGLVPIDNKGDLLHRYQYIQQFLKDSKQFGAQRRASEGTAVEVALENLAISAGFTDVTRLTLMAESELIHSAKAYLEWYEVNDVSVRLMINSWGQASIEYKKKEKVLSAAPASIKKHEYFLTIKDLRKKLMDQYSRTVGMFETAMECKTTFVYTELSSLLNNQVIAPIISNLVFLCEENASLKIGFLTKDGLLDCHGAVLVVSSDSNLRVAHPYDLYQKQCWHQYQAYFFEKENMEGGRKQPFKQVFRELYVKVQEELKQKYTLMFAGNQIQPKKTIGCLKNRRWIADYHEGLQKIYYKDNIVANIYAMADWFSPSDIEAPTLERVVFYDRKTFETLTIDQIPDIIYSEVMRDVDLAVSVAHAGGVDPESSHSTIEMRKAIIEFNLPLFALENVVLEGRHAMIKGKRAEYNLHLGSGIIHKVGGPLIHILPVHSQSRGKLFLPFIDEDPKTAEIMSKIVLLARDEKIKDPYILDQL